MSTAPNIPKTAFNDFFMIRFIRMCPSSFIVVRSKSAAIRDVKQHYGLRFKGNQSVLPGDVSIVSDRTQSVMLGLRSKACGPPERSLPNDYAFASIVTRNAANAAKTIACHNGAKYSPFCDGFPTV